MASDHPSAASGVSPAVIPSRLMVQKWEREVEAIERTIEIETEVWYRRLAKLNHDHEVLVSKIWDGWLSRAPAIPTDALECIMDYLSTESPRYLSRLCLISKAWLTPARRLLYRNIRLHWKDTDNFIATVRRTPSIRLCVHSLDVEIEAFKKIDYFSLLENCVIRLTVDLQSEDQDLFRNLWPRLPNVSELKRVTVNASDDNDDDDSEYDRSDDKDDLLYGWPLFGVQPWDHLEELELRSYSFDSNDVPFQRHFPNVHFGSLKVLTFINCVNIVFPATPNNTLQILALDACSAVDDSSYISLIKRNANSIRDIKFMHSDFDITIENDFVYDRVVSEAKCAERVTLDACSEYMSPEFFHSLPATILHLKIMSYAKAFSPYNIIEYLYQRQSSPNSLQTLTIGSDISGLAEEWEEVRSMAQEMGFEFSLE
jgi:hypothetical protein